jgi:hypothetical protein
MGASCKQLLYFFIARKEIGIDPEQPGFQLWFGKRLNI